MQDSQRVESRESAGTALIMLAAIVVVVAGLETMLHPALPLVQRELGLTPSEAALLSTILVLSGAVTTPMAGRLADIFGGTRVLHVLIAITVAGSTISAIAPTLSVMMVGQALQGTGIGVLPIAFVLLRGLFSSGGMKIAVGLVTSMAMIGGGAGTILAGPMAEGISRAWMFGIPTVILTVLGLGAIWIIPPSLPSLDVKKGRVDWAGAILFAAALSAFLYGISRMPQDGILSTRSVLTMIIICVLGTSWFLVERRATTPMVDLKILRNRGVWSACVMSFTAGLATATTYFLIPQLLAIPAEFGYGFGSSVTEIGFLMLPGILISVVAGPLAGVADRKYGSRPVAVVGLLALILSSAFVIALHDERWHIYLTCALLGIGIVGTSTALYNVAVSSVDSEYTGIATGLTVVSRAVGSAIGIQVAGVTLTLTINNGTGLPTESGFRWGFATTVCVALVAIVIARVLPRSSVEKADHESDGSITVSRAAG